MTLVVKLYPIFILVLLLGLNSCDSGAVKSIAAESQYYTHVGEIHGTYFSMKYEHTSSLNISIDSVLAYNDNLLSNYKDSSEISIINRSSTYEMKNEIINNLLETSFRISEETKGAFDVTVGPLVNAWGFGFRNKIELDSAVIDSIRNYIGFKNLIIKNHVLNKDTGVIVDIGAIAKGLSVDLIASYLMNNNVDNYLVEIGGEVRVSGINDKGSLWTIGIDKPVDDPLASNRELQEIVELSNISIATSGNYRRFYVKDGVKYSHTIDPISGYPVNHNLLSASVLHKECMLADAYATAFMVMGVDKTKEFIENRTDIDVFLIYATSEGMETFITKGFEKRIKR